MKKFLSVFIPIVIFIGLICTMNISYATNTTGSSGSDYFNDFNGSAPDRVNNATQTIFGTAISVVRIAGTAIAIVMLTYIGIKYMTAAPEGKAELKKTLTFFVVGAVLFFGTTEILGIIEKYFSDL